MLPKIDTSKMLGAVTAAALIAVISACAQAEVGAEAQPTSTALPTPVPASTSARSPTVPAIPATSTPAPQPTSTGTPIPSPPTPRPIAPLARTTQFIAFDNPVFVSAANAPARVQPDSFVLGLDWNGDVRAYPLDMMWWHHIVNDTVEGDPVLVTY
jgi:hypothetical protein